MELVGSRIHRKQLSDSEYDKQLRIKLLEEADEVRAAQSRDELVEELADVFEVIDAFCALHSISKDEIIHAQEKKRTERGGFAQDAFVATAEHPEGSLGEQYCLAQPGKNILK